MGIFSSKRRIHVDTAVVRVIEGEQVPQSNITGAVQGIIAGRPLVKSIKNAIIHGPYRKFESMYQFAATPGNYTFGLPDARVLSSDDGIDAAKVAIENEVGSTVAIDYLHFRPLNNTHMGWKTVTEEYGYVHETNELTGLSTSVGFPVYLEDLVPKYVIPADAEAPDSLSRSAFGNSPQTGYTPERVSRGGTIDIIGNIVKSQDWEEAESGPEGVTIKYIWEDADGEIQKDSIFKDLSGYDNTAEFYQGRYRYTEGGEAIIGYWTYNPESGTHPDIDSVYDFSYTAPGTYFPFAIFRREKINYADEALEDTDEFKSTKELLSKLNIDFQQVGEQINENPDIDQVEQAVMMMGVPINATHPAEIEYLFRFFKWLHTVTPIIPRLTVEQQTAGGGIRPNRAIEFADGGFRVVMSYDDIAWRTRAGSIGPKGTYSTHTDVAENIGTIAIPGGKLVVQYYRYQVSDSAYEQVAVMNPRMRYDIRDDHQVLGNGTDDICLVPVNREIAHEMVLLEREQLYYRSLHLVFNSYVVEKVEWYQRGAFKVFMIILAVVIAFYTGYFDVLIVAIEAGSLTQIGIAVVTMVIEKIVIDYVFELLVGALGVEVAVIIATVSALVGAGFIVKGGKAAMGWAETLLKASTGLTSGVGAELERLVSKYQAEVSEFELLKEEKAAELEAGQDLLDQKNLLDPFAFIGETPMVRHNESPQDYFNRTVHSGNVGVVGFDFIEYFVDTSLKLPDIQDTLGDTFYV